MVVEQLNRSSSSLGISNTQASVARLTALLKFRIADSAARGSSVEEALSSAFLEILLAATAQIRMGEGRSVAHECFAYARVRRRFDLWSCGKRAERLLSSFPRFCGHCLRRGVWWMRVCWMGYVLSSSWMGEESADPRCGTCSSREVSRARFAGSRRSSPQWAPTRWTRTSTFHLFISNKGRRAKVYLTLRCSRPNLAFLNLLLTGFCRQELISIDVGASLGDGLHPEDLQPQPVRLISFECLLEFGGLMHRSRPKTFTPGSSRRGSRTG